MKYGVASHATLLAVVLQAGQRSRLPLVPPSLPSIQGVVYWQPPESATNKIERIIREPVVSRYGSDDGLLEHREALLEKLCRENKLTKSSVMVTAGANQVFVNLVLTPCDAGDSVVMLAPYYFNACMTFQMAIFY